MIYLLNTLVEILYKIPFMSGEKGKRKEIEKEEENYRFLSSLRKQITHRAVNNYN